MSSRVLVLLNSLAIGGAEVFAVDCAIAMKRDGWDVEVARLRGRDDLAGDLERGGVRTHLVPWHRLFHFLRRGGYDVFQTHHNYAGAVGRVMATAARVPAIVTTEQIVIDALPTKYKLARDVTITLAHAVVCISRGVKDSVRDGIVPAPRIAPDRVSIIPNGVNLTKLDRRAAATDREAMRRSLGLPADGYVIGTVGRLVDQKGQRYLIEALPRIRRAIPHAVVVVAGRGELEADLRSRAARENVANATVFLGERTDVIEIMRAFDLFAFPSKYEGLGVVLLEALSAGLPVVATGIPGVTDVIDETTGVLVPPHDPSALAGAIVALARDPARGAKLAAAGRRRVEQQFEIGAAARAYGELYTRLLSRARAG